MHDQEQETADTSNYRSQQEPQPSPADGSSDPFKEEFMYMESKLLQMKAQTQALTKRLNSLQASK